MTQSTRTINDSTCTCDKCGFTLTNFEHRTAGCTHASFGGTFVTRLKFVNTTWELRTYDVWGNSRDGYEVNDTYRAGTVTIRCRVTVNNAGTPQEFMSASPSDSQIRKALSLRRFAIDTDGDDLHITVDRARDGYPCGELYCISHVSLSPIIAKRNGVTE